MESIKVKSYKFQAFCFSRLVFILSFVVYVIMLINVLFINYSDKTQLTIIVWSFLCGPIILISLISCLVIYFGCKIYDVYTEEGFKRVRKFSYGIGKECYATLYDVKWSEVDKISYSNSKLIGFISLFPCCISIDLKEEIKSYNQMNDCHYSNNAKYITSIVSYKQYKKIKKAIPINITKVRANKKIRIK